MKPWQQLVAVIWDSQFLCAQRAVYLVLTASPSTWMSSPAVATRGAGSPRGQATTVARHVLDGIVPDTLRRPDRRKLSAISRSIIPHHRPSPEPADGRSEPANLLLMVGLPGAGKTIRAQELAAVHRALRLTPDEWMISLFHGSQPDGKRDLLEGRLIALALQALQLGTNVVLDFGLWSRDERSALRWLATSAGASCQVVYLPVDKDVQRARIAHRQATAPHTTFPMNEADIDEWRKQFQAPDAAELGGGDIPGPPPGWLGWAEWAADRWPSLANDDASQPRRRHRPADEETDPPGTGK